MRAPSDVKGGVMDLSSLVRKSDHEWWIPQTDAMRVPGVIYGSETLVRAHADKSLSEEARGLLVPIDERRSTCDTQC